MRQSTLLLPTLREIPAEADTVSHQLLLRAGFIRQLAAGIYTYLPLGLRVLRKLEQIVREEMDRSGAQELLMPAMQPAELWKESGRYDLYGPELVRLQDRHQREFTLGPTHEEVITTLIRQEINSYRKLPVNLYQIQTKFRYERRPRFGLLRGREFLMKDAYSFDTDWDGLNRTYNTMFETYQRIFQRCGLRFRAVEADAGTIGGEGGTHEFMALADIGEDTIASCTCCDYAANLEKAVSKAPVRMENSQSATDTLPTPEHIHTPGIRTIQDLTNHLHIQATDIIKTLIYLEDEQPVAILIRGDQDLNEIKVINYLNAVTFQMADAQTVKQVTGAPVGFAGPYQLQIRVLVDEQVANMRTGITGANQADTHLKHIVPGRDFTMMDTGDFRNVSEGDLCPVCNDGTLVFHRGIEIGHIFKLGKKYSEKLQATFLDPQGKEQVMIMGCYGIGVSRMLSALVEQHHDDQGMKWPSSVAPYQVHIIPISVKDTTQMQLAEHLYLLLQDKGIEVLMDDRDERPGVKFKDSDLIGLPYRIIVGKDAGEGFVELVERADGVKRRLSVEEVLSVFEN
ncbi:prolyl-tRNA synthetase [Paenibacillus swuensis]|uniref:Proline--tRNA ligase n=1 Tax=Paenibacillus swuensis TaxID=1178515 RepID=A0A172TG21_9BACL|nr:proline--tRNA ligase [Paenibacillus swuensis]ANE45733.1 prolyl-tRNA synthetase [Paenibacillus swuensis]